MSAQPPIEPLVRAHLAVEPVVRGILPEQFGLPTPCTEWSVRDILGHLTGLNQVFVALLTGQAPPPRGQDPLGDDPIGAYLDSAAALEAAFGQPGALERVFAGPLGDATGAERMKIRIYDLLAHGWDLAQATGQHLEVPDDVAEASWEFARTQLGDGPRAHRFREPQPVDDDAPAIDRLVAFLGRPLEGPTRP
ncbi:TIGR03086 family metal-binding protein [Arthrobacter sp.]|uniref:TIGR03086 family metal-binding protein n=1 Tax=Arthrobacter sp. TaxID=1667 RepID=UPI003A91406C